MAAIRSANKEFIYMKNAPASELFQPRAPVTFR